MNAHDRGQARWLALAVLLAFGASMSAALLAGQRARAQGVVIGGCDITQFTQCPNADLSGHNMSTFNLTGSNLQGADFQGDVLDGTDLSFTYLYGTNFSGANLNFVNFTAAILVGADFSGATLANITWLYTFCPDGTTSEQDGGTCAGHVLLNSAGRGEEPSPTATPEARPSATPRPAETPAAGPPGCNIGDTHNCP